eukprot:6588099-Pyramimonas_sp.AAC.1
MEPVWDVAGEAHQPPVLQHLLREVQRGESARRPRPRPRWLPESQVEATAIPDQPRLLDLVWGPPTIGMTAV